MFPWGKMTTYFSNLMDSTVHIRHAKTSFTPSPATVFLLLPLRERRLSVFFVEQVSAVELILKCRIKIKINVLQIGGNYVRRYSVFSFSTVFMCFCYIYFYGIIWGIKRIICYLYVQSYFFGYSILVHHTRFRSIPSSWSMDSI